MLFILIDVLINIPFGFTYETVFYSKMLFSSLFFGILITIWIFSDYDDGIIFLTYSIFLPVNFNNFIDNLCSKYSCFQLIF